MRIEELKMNEALLIEDFLKTTVSPAVHFNYERPERGAGNEYVFRKMEEVKEMSDKDERFRDSCLLVGGLMIALLSNFDSLIDDIRKRDEDNQGFTIKE